MRKAIDCRDYPSDINCTVALSADTADELLEIAVAHAVGAHGHKDSPELRAVLRGLCKDVAGEQVAGRQAAGACVDEPIAREHAAR
jgi:hypothetical protein